MRQLLQMAASALIIGGSLCAGTAHADEEWTSGEETIIYDYDQGELAVLSMGDMQIFVEGLGGIYEGRGSYNGVWALDGTPMMRDEAGNEVPAPGCSVELVRPGKTATQTRYWGQVELTFIDPDFPGTWIAYFGDCFDPPSETLIARPVVAD